MRLVTIDSSVLKKYCEDTEMLHKAKRPSALIVKLTYKGHRYSFAVPMRSNISPSSPKDEYFPLPPASKTKPKYHHGLHYIKMFPIKISNTHPYHTEGNIFASLCKSIIDAHEKEIVHSCQQYLANYEQGLHSQYSTDIDLLITKMLNS